ncbi:hypothetical protein C8Q77DRAFT_220515 [Trametes polyzona]|nr:hypothetical protein C8Q77DRAFT_220515 [Trametes polyzona]
MASTALLWIFLPFRSNAMVSSVSSRGCAWIDGTAWVSANVALEVRSSRALRDRRAFGIARTGSERGVYHSRSQRIAACAGKMEQRADHDESVYIARDVGEGDSLSRNDDARLDKRTWGPCEHRNPECRETRPTTTPPVNGTHLGSQTSAIVRHQRSAGTPPAIPLSLWCVCASRTFSQVSAIATVRAQGRLPRCLGVLEDEKLVDFEPEKRSTAAPENVLAFSWGCCRWAAVDISPRI